MNAERLKKLRLTMTKVQYGRYYGLLEDIEKAQDGKNIKPLQRLFVAEREIAEQPISIVEALRL